MGETSMMPPEIEREPAERLDDPKEGMSVAETLREGFTPRPALTQPLKPPSMTNTRPKPCTASALASRAQGTSRCDDSRV
jgi:hypothetical protein